MRTPLTSQMVRDAIVAVRRPGELLEGRPAQRARLAPITAVVRAALEQAAEHGPEALQNAARTIQRRWTSWQATNRGTRGGAGASSLDRSLPNDRLGSGAFDVRSGSRSGHAPDGPRSTNYARRRMPRSSSYRRSGKRARRSRSGSRRRSRGNWRVYSKRKPVGFKGSVRKRVMTDKKRFKPSLKVTKKFRRAVKKVIATSAPQVVKFFRLTQTAAAVPGEPHATIIGTADEAFSPQRPDSMVYPAGSNSAFISGQNRREQTGQRGLLMFPFNIVRVAQKVDELKTASLASDPVPHFRGKYYHPTYLAVRCGWLPGESVGAPGTTNIPTVSRVEHGFGYITNFKKLEGICTAVYGTMNPYTIRQALFLVLGPKGKRDQLCMISGTGWTQKSIDLRNEADTTKVEAAYHSVKALHTCFRIVKRVYTEIRPQVKEAVAAGGVAAVASGLRGEGVMFGKTQYKFKLPSKHVIRPKCLDGGYIASGHMSMNEDSITGSPFVSGETVFQMPPQRSWIPFVFARGDAVNTRTDFPDSLDTKKAMIAGNGATTSDNMCAFYCDWKVGIRDEMEE